MVLLMFDVEIDAKLLHPPCFDYVPDVERDRTIASVTATPWTISSVGIGYAGPPLRGLRERLERTRA